jgi:hypothetical protein
MNSRVSRQGRKTCATCADAAAARQAAAKTFPTEEELAARKERQRERLRDWKRSNPDKVREANRRYWVHRRRRDREARQASARPAQLALFDVA